MRVYSDKNVYDAALDRIRWVFDEFPNVVVNVSGGKDSTVVFELSKIVAREKHRLPLTVMFIDQEAEWNATIENMRKIMYDPDVCPRWYQMPIVLFNASSTVEHWLHCWDPLEEKNWMRPKEPIAVTENVYGTERFHELFDAIMDHEYAGQKAAYIEGIRCEESPHRNMGLTYYLTYKDVTWGNVNNKKEGHYSFSPIYDWAYSDVWKAIFTNHWPYCKIYDTMFAHNIPLQNMRVSNLHHETAVRSLFSLQEYEPETYDRLVCRLKGVDMAGKLGKEDYFVGELPFMFHDWREYRDYLLEHLIHEAGWKERFQKIFAKQERLFSDALGDKLYKVHINSILTNDWEMVKLTDFEHSPQVSKIRQKEKHLGRWANDSV